jgi:hypothetical protein
MIFLKKGREIFTGIPDFHQIRLRVLVLVFDLIYIGTENERNLFPYTPYLAKVNAALYIECKRISDVIRYSLLQRH